MMRIAGDPTSANQLRHLSSVFAGIFMCKIVYDLTAVIGEVLFKGYSKLSNKDKLEWNNRGFSTFHAIVVFAAALYLLFVSNLFVDDAQDQLMINRSSYLSDTVLGVSIGYFISDIALIFYHYPTLGGMEYMVHHGLSAFSIALALLTSQAHVYVLMILLTESTTPFVNIRWHLDVMGLKNSKIYIYNGIALFIGWLVARVAFFVYIFYHMSIHFDEVAKMFPMGYYNLITVPPMLSGMNLIWFCKIAKGMVKTLRKARRSQ